MKKLFLFFTTTFLFVVSNAQISEKKLPSFQVGIALAPLSNSITSISYNTGIAINVSADIKKINENLMLFGETGLILFPGNGSGSSYKSPDGTFIPFIFGANYISNNLKIGAGIGYSMFNSGDYEAGTVSGITFSPRVAYSIGKFDLQAKYINATSNSRYLWTNASNYQYGIIYKF
jgi:hypothetical protein